MDYNQVLKYCKKSNNAPKVIPVVKYEQMKEEKIPINHTHEEKEQKAKEYLIEKGYPTS